MYTLWPALSETVTIFTQQSIVEVIFTNKHGTSDNFLLQIDISANFEDTSSKSK